MEDAAAVLAAKDGRMAERLANRIPRGEDLIKMLGRDLISHMLNKHGVDILSSTLENPHAPDVEIMTNIYLPECYPIH